MYINIEKRKKVAQHEIIATNKSDSALIGSAIRFMAPDGREEDIVVSKVKPSSWAKILGNTVLINGKAKEGDTIEISVKDKQNDSLFKKAAKFQYKLQRRIFKAGDPLVLVNNSNKCTAEQVKPIRLVKIGDRAFTEETKQAVEALMADAKAQGFELRIDSAWRSVQRQAEVYKKMPSIAAQPGASEHHTGLAVDLLWGGRMSAATRAASDEYKWIVANLHKYGFILRFPKGQEDVTEVTFEPWHYRYIGKDNAQAYIDSGARTFEEFMSDKGNN